MRTDETHPPATGQPTPRTPAVTSTPRSRRLRSRLAAGLAAATAIAFVLTVAAVASSPPTPPDTTATPPPSVAPSELTTRPDTSAARRDAALADQPGSRDDRPTDDAAQGDAGPAATEPAPPADTAPTPQAPPPAEDPPAAEPVEPAQAPRDHGAPLWGRWFRAEQLRDGDERVLVAGDGPLHVGFVRQERGDGLVWMTSCNTFGGDLAVRRDRLRVRDIGGTAAECEEVQQEQEEWLADLFAADPHWRSLGEQLRLWTPDGRRIDLVEDPEGPGPPWS